MPGKPAKNKATRQNDGNGGGRPTKYRGEYCQELIEHMGNQGLSYESFAGVIGVSIQTLYEWEAKHKRFFEAKQEAFAKNRVWWERVGAAGMAGKIPGFNSTVWVFSMKNRHGWRDRIETENKTQIEAKVNLNGHIVNLVEEFEAGGGADPEDC